MHLLFFLLLTKLFQSVSFPDHKNPFFCLNSRCCSCLSLNRSFILKSFFFFSTYTSFSFIFLYKIPCNSKSSLFRFCKFILSSSSKSREFGKFKRRTRTELSCFTRLSIKSFEKVFNTPFPHIHKCQYLRLNFGGTPKWGLKKNLT